MALRLKRTSQVADVIAEVERKYGKLQAERLKQAGDEGVDLSRWNPKELSDQFGHSVIPQSGSKIQNSGLLMSFPTNEFENYARPIMYPGQVPYQRWEDNVPRSKRPHVLEQTLPNYLNQYTDLNTKRGIGTASDLLVTPGQVEEHEGRHLMRMLQRLGDKRGLVNVRPMNSAHLVGEPDEVIERLNRMYFPQGKATEYTPQPTGFPGGQRDALPFPVEGFGGGGFNDVEDRFSIPNSSFYPPSGSQGEMPTAEFPLGKGQGSAGFRYDPTEQVIEALLGYKHPLGKRGATLGGALNFDKYIGPGGNEAKPNLGGALRLTLPFADGGEVPEYKVRGRVQAVEGLAKKLGDAVEDAEANVRKHTQNTGNESLVLGHFGTSGYENSALVPGTKTQVAWPDWVNRFVDSNAEKPWFNIHTHPNANISPSLADYQTWGRPFASLLDDHAYGNMLIAREPQDWKGLLRIGAVDAGGDMPHALGSAVRRSKLNLDNRLRHDSGFTTQFADYLKSNKLFDPGILDDQRWASVYSPTIREMAAGHLLNNIAARDVPVQLDAKTMLTGTNAPLADVWSELAKLAAKRGEDGMAQGGAVPHFGGLKDQLVKGAGALSRRVEKRASERGAGLPTVGSEATPMPVDIFSTEALHSMVNPTTPEVPTPSPSQPASNPFIAANRFIASPTPLSPIDLTTPPLGAGLPSPGGSYGMFSAPNLQPQAARETQNKLAMVKNVGGVDNWERLVHAQDLGANLGLYTPTALANAVAKPTNMLTVMDPARFQKDFAARIPDNILNAPNYRNAAEYNMLGKHGNLQDVLEHYAEVGKRGEWDEVPLLGFGDPQIRTLQTGAFPTHDVYPGITAHNGRHRMMVMERVLNMMKALHIIKPNLWLGNNLNAHFDPEKARDIFKTMMSRNEGKVVPQNEWYDPLTTRGLTEQTLPKIEPVFAEGGPVRNYRIGGFGEIDYPTDDSDDPDGVGALSQVGWKREAADNAARWAKRLEEKEAEINKRMRSSGEDQIYLAPDPRQTVNNPERLAFPGIYKSPQQIVAEAKARYDAGDEDAMRRLFGVGRHDLDDIMSSRTWDHLLLKPHAYYPPPGATGSKNSANVLTDRNMNRITNIAEEALGDPQLRLTRSWYEMQPLWDRMNEMGLSPEYQRMFNTRVGLHSAGASPVSEWNRGTGANWLIEQGRLQDYLDFGGIPEARKIAMHNQLPQDMLQFPGHAYHSTAHSKPLINLEASGQLWTDRHKVPTYVQATDPILADPRRPIADAHLARGVGYSDVRTGGADQLFKELTTSEYGDFVPWWEKAAGKVDMWPRDMQAMIWNALGPQTGVRIIGPGKLEMLSGEIMKAAHRLGVSPETARDLVLSGKAAAHAEGGQVDNFDDGGQMTFTPEQRKILREARLRQSNERLDAQADKSSLYRQAIGELISEGAGHEWDRFSHNAKGNPLMYGIDAFNRATAGTSGMEALEDTVSMLNPNPNFTGDYGPVAAPLDLAAITMGTALTPSRLLGGGMRAAIRSMENKIPGILSKLAITGGAPTAAKATMEGLGYAGGGNVGKDTDAALLEWIKRIIPNATDIYGNTPYDPNLDRVVRGAETTKIPPMNMPAARAEAPPANNDMSAILGMLTKFGSMAAGAGGGAGATAAGSGTMFAEGGYFGPSRDEDMPGAYDRDYQRMINTQSLLGQQDDLMGDIDYLSLLRRMVPSERLKAEEFRDPAEGFRHPSYAQLAADPDLRRGRTRMAPRFAEGGSVDDDMLNYHTMFYADGGQVDLRANEEANGTSQTLPTGWQQGSVTHGWSPFANFQNMDPGASAGMSPQTLPAGWQQGSLPQGSQGQDWSSMFSDMQARSTPQGSQGVLANLAAASGMGGQNSTPMSMMDGGGGMGGGGPGGNLPIRGQLSIQGNF